MAKAVPMRRMINGVSRSLEARKMDAICGIGPVGRVIEIGI
jgi:hypothetical protein